MYVKANGKGWTDLGGDFSAISATADNTVFAIGGGNVVYVNHGSGFSPLGGDAKAISAGLDAAGKPEVFAIGRDNAVYVNDDGKGWVDLGGGHCYGDQRDGGRHGLRHRRRQRRLRQPRVGLRLTGWRRERDQRRR